MCSGICPQFIKALLRPRPLILGVSLTAWLAVVSAGPAPTADEKPLPPAEAALPPDLDAVPRDALGFVSIRVADLWNADFVADARREAMKLDPKFYQDAEAQERRDFERKWGTPWTAIERFTMTMLELPSPDSDDSTDVQKTMLVVITTIKPYDRGRLLKELVPDANENKYQDRAYFADADEKGSAVHILNDRTYVLGKVNRLKQLFDRLARKKADGPLGEALQRAAEKHLVVAGLNAPPLAKMLGQNLPQEAEPFKPLLEAQSATLVADLGRDVRLQLRLSFSGANEAEQGEKAVKAALQMACQSLEQGMKELAKDKEGASELRTVKRIHATLKAVPVQRGGSTLRAALQYSIEPAEFEVVVIRIREASQRIVTGNNLKEIGLALHDYHDTYLCFPAAAIYSKGGKPLLSWRVAILPYLDQQELYKQFHLDEPWDSEHNKKLLAKMPKFYAPTVPGLTKDPYATFYQVFTGKGAIFEGKEGVSLTQITNADGAANTLLVVEASEAVPWTKPQDLHYDPDKPPPKLGCHFRHVSPALFADGSVLNINNVMKESVVRALITWNGGEDIKRSDYAPD
jgi:hypothetical protein